MENVRQLICINCPMGCRLKVTKSENNGWLVEGNECNRGKTYAVIELTAPTRVLTTTVILNSSLFRRLPVRTDKGIPKDKIFEAMKVLDKIKAEAPIHTGDVICCNILGTGVNVIASRSVL